jgi:two-component system response regulator AtoC
MAGAPTVLVVDDDEIIRVSLEDRLRMEGFETVSAADFTTACALLEQRGFEQVCRFYPGVPVILMTGFISIEDAVALTKAGAADYLTKPFDLDEFVAKARQAVERARDLGAAPLIGPDGNPAPPGSGILGRSAAMRRIEEVAARIRDVDSSVLLTGESGVGKTQVKLLRVLQERRIERLGGVVSVELDVRVITATQVDLEAAIAEGSFRADLFWRLNVIRIDVPPLRERPEDILFLARRFAAEQAELMARPVTGIATAAEQRLLTLDYPGNVRELRNIVERAVALTSGSQIQEHDLFIEGDTGADAEMPLNLRASVEATERAAILRALERAGGTIQVAAHQLGISRKNLWEKMRRYKIGRPQGN